jgi:hypothetical protein
MPPVHLDRLAGDVVRELGRVVLAERGEEPHELQVLLQLGLEGRALRVGPAAFRGEVGPQRVGHVDQRRRPVEQRPRGLDVQSHVREHRLDERLVHDGLVELHARLSEFQRFAECRLRDPDRLRGDAEPCVVHEIEHRPEALSARPEQERLGAVEIDHAGGRAVNAELPLHANDLDAIRAAVGQRARAEHQGEPARRALGLVVGRGITGEDQMDRGAAVGDEDLLSIEDKATILLRHAGGYGAEIGAGLGLGQVHGALQLARGKAGQVAAPQLVRAVFLDVLCHATLEPDDGHQARVRLRDHLEIEGVEEQREAVTTELRAQREAE